MKYDRTRLVAIIISCLPLSVGSALAFVVRNSSLIGRTINNQQSFTPIELMIQALVSIVLGSMVVFSLFWILHRRGRGTKKIIVSFVVSPMMFFVSLFLGQAFLLVIFKGSRTALEGLVMVISMGVSLLSIVFIVMDAIPPIFRSVYVGFYGAVFGTFLAATLVTSTVYVLVVTIIAEDWILTRYSPAAQSVKMMGNIGEDPFDYTRVKSKHTVIGVGDFIAYSLIASHSFLFLPGHVWLSSMLLAVLGVIVNLTVLAKKDEILPAIPIPAALAMFPWIAHLVTLIYFV